MEIDLSQSRMRTFESHSGVPRGEPGEPGDTIARLYRANESPSWQRVVQVFNFSFNSLN